MCYYNVAYYWIFSFSDSNWLEVYTFLFPPTSSCNMGIHRILHPSLSRYPHHPVANSNHWRLLPWLPPSNVSDECYIISWKERISSRPLYISPHIR